LRKNLEFIKWKKRAFERRKNTLAILVAFSIIISMTATAVSAAAEIQDQVHPLRPAYD
jgi:hypothetical protein